MPVKIHINERPEDFGRFRAEWTPTLIIAEPDGTERYRFVGFLPVEDFLAQLRLGLARAAFSRGEFRKAQDALRGVAETHPHSEAAPEALYWAGASAYKATHDPEHLRETGKVLRARYPRSDWAKKSSVWLKPRRK